MSEEEFMGKIVWRWEVRLVHGSCGADSRVVREWLGAG